jgi:hypothetical protein
MLPHRRSAIALSLDACTGDQCKNAVGRVELSQKHIAVGYITHPAVTDSSMHLAVFTGKMDGITRVPGECLHALLPVEASIQHKAHTVIDILCTNVSSQHDWVLHLEDATVSYPAFPSKPTAYEYSSSFSQA